MGMLKTLERSRCSSHFAIALSDFNVVLGKMLLTLYIEVGVFKFVSMFIGGVTLDDQGVLVGNVVKDHLVLGHNSPTVCIYLCKQDSTH